MNVPLKKRHNYGKLNGSTTSLNQPSAKRLHSTYSNYDDSEYEHQSSNMDESLLNRPATLGCFPRGEYGEIDDIEKTNQNVSMGDKGGPSNVHAIGESTVVSSSSSVIMSSSASNHESCEHNDDETTSTSDSDGSSKSSDKENNSEALSACDPLTEDAIIQHNSDFEPMNSKERIQFWNIADKFSDVEDDFDDRKYFSKPIRSERVQKRMYTQPAPVFSLSRKYRKNKTDQKEQKSRKTDDKPRSSTKKPKDKRTEAKKIKASLKRQVKPVIKSVPVKSPIPPKSVGRKKTPKRSLLQPLKSQVEYNIGVSRPTNDIPSGIKFRVSYGKDVPIRPESFKAPTTPYTSGCANCSKHANKLNDSLSSSLSTDMPEMSSSNQEEFYKYLRIDTNPSQEKMAPSEPSPTDANNRRSLRVFIQQKQNDFTRSADDKSIKDDQSPRLKSPTATSNSPNILESNVHNQLLDNSKILPQINGKTKSILISSHIKQRHSYEPPSELNVDASRPNGIDNILSISLSESETEFDAPKQDANSMKFGESSDVTVTKVVRRPKRKIILPSPIMLTEMFKRYKQCFRQGFAMRQQLRKQTLKRIKKRPPNIIVQPNNSTNQTENIDSIKTVETNGIKNIDPKQPSISTCDDLINTFSTTSITHSNASSTDSAIVVNSNVNALGKPQITLKSTNSLQWQRDQINHIDKSQFRNPLDPKKGAVQAILTHSVSPNNNEIVIVIQESQISYWYSTAKVLTMFGIAYTWSKIGEIPRITEDTEVNALYQHRLLDLGEQFPVYVEMRARESPPDEFRQCNLTFAYLNVYHVKSNDDGQPQIVMDRVNLDTLKGYANSIYYTALKMSPGVLMTWTEHNVNNQTRCGIVKYTLKSPSLDNIEDIFDYSYLQHDIKTLFAFNDYHVVGCGDRTVSMWDHRNGNLLIDIEIELPTIGQNIACYTVGDDVPEYMLLVQLMASDEINDECSEQLKIMAVQTVHPYNWRAVQAHKIPSSYGKIRSIFNQNDLLTITFSSGTLMFLNISSPHKIYVRSVLWPNGKKVAIQVNGLSNAKTGANEMPQLFTQCNGHIFDVASERIGIKSVWEYFIDKD